MASPGLLDPTKAGKYPVILSDALLGKDSNELYTGVRYNHKPNLSSSIGPESARLKPTPGAAKKGNTYDLSFLDNDERYTYQGSRRTEDGHYVLIFDSSREVFILHKVDSLFNMNVIRTPNNSDADSLRREYPQLDEGRPAGAKPAAAKTKETKPRKQPTAASKKKESQEKKATLPMPEKQAPPAKPAPPPPKPKHVQPEEDSDEDDSDDDFGLTIENPGGDDPSTAPSHMFSPAFGARRFHEFVQEQEREASEEQEREAMSQEDEDEDEDHEEEDHDHGGGAALVDDDADAEDDDDEDTRSIENFKLPSPMRRQMETHQNGINHHQPPPQQPPQQVEEEEVSEEDEAQMVDVDPADDADDLEAEFMAALEEDHMDQESDVSEEE